MRKLELTLSNLHADHCNFGRLLPGHARAVHDHAHFAKWPLHCAVPAPPEKVFKNRPKVVKLLRSKAWRFNLVQLVDNIANRL